MNHIIARIDAAGLRASTYRVARRLLDRAHPGNGFVSLDYDEMATICETDSQSTVRGHLVALAAAGLLTYRRNARVHVMWHDWVIQGGSVCSRGGSDAAEMIQSGSLCTCGGSDVDAEMIQGGSLCTCGGSDAGKVIQDRSNCTHRRSKRAPVDHPIAGKQAGRQAIEACLPAGEGAGGGSPPRSDDFDRSVRLLMDPEGPGVDEATARRWARGWPFVTIRAHVFRWLRDRQRNGQLGPGVIGKRLAEGWGASCSAEDEQSPLWLRYAGEEEATEQRRRRYMPDEYADVIQG